MELHSIFGDNKLHKLWDKAMRKGIEIDYKECWEIRLRSMNVSINDIKNIDKGISKIPLGEKHSASKKFIVEPCDKVFDELEDVTDFLEDVKDDKLYFVISKPDKLESISWNKLPGGIYKLFLDFESSTRPYLTSSSWGDSLDYVDKNEKPIVEIGYNFSIGCGKYEKRLGELRLDTSMLPDFIGEIGGYRRFEYASKNQITFLYVPEKTIVNCILIGGDPVGWER